MAAFSAVELYALLKLRVDVFVVEQACVYPELDGKDEDARHLRLLIDGETAAYARCGNRRTGRRASAASSFRLSIAAGASARP